MKREKPLIDSLTVGNEQVVDQYSSKVCGEIFEIVILVFENYLGHFSSVDMCWSLDLEVQGSNPGWGVFFLLNSF